MGLGLQATWGQARPLPRATPTRPGSLLRRESCLCPCGPLVANVLSDLEPQPTEASGHHPTPHPKCSTVPTKHGQPSAIRSEVGSRLYAPGVPTLPSSHLASLCHTLALNQALGVQLRPVGAGASQAIVLISTKWRSQSSGGVCGRARVGVGASDISAEA